MKDFTPMLFTSLKSYSKEQFVKDAVSGVIVAIIALPLSIALALASGVGPEQGIYTAIVAGFLISFFGGSTVQIAGPTAAFATIVAGIVARQGMEGLTLATIMAGLILVIMGIFRFGGLIKYIPYTITTGFTAGIAVTIFLGQLKDFFGVKYMHGEAPIETLEKVEALINNFSTWNVWAMVVGLICLAILIVYPMFEKRVPPSLVAVIVSSIIVKLFGLPVNTIGDLYTISSGLPAIHMPVFSISGISAVLPDAFTIAILAGIESLLSCVVADGMVNTRHRSNMELVAQGIGNVGSALFGGIPATGAIARTAANIKSGGRTPVAGMVHAIVLLLVLLVLMPLAALIPMPCIAAILFIVAYNMCQWRPFVKLVKTAPKSDILVLVLTFVLTVVFDLVVAIEVGMVLACLLFMKRMSDETYVSGWKDEGIVGGEVRKIPMNVRVYEISGPMFFGAAGQIDDISLEENTSVLVLRMRSVPAVDATALNSLEKLYARCAEQNVTLIMSHVNEQPMNAMEKSGLAEKIGKDNFCPCIEKALERADILT